MRVHDFLSFLTVDADCDGAKLASTSAEVRGQNAFVERREAPDDSEGGGPCTATVRRRSAQALSRTA